MRRRKLAIGGHQGQSLNASNTSQGFSKIKSLYVYGQIEGWSSAKALCSFLTLGLGSFNKNCSRFSFQDLRPANIVYN